MAKTIKFNLVLDGVPVRDLEDLRNYFSIEDVLEYYHDGLLVRWLKVRGYDDLLEKVTTIQFNDDFELIQELITIFDIETNPEKIVEGIEILSFLEGRKYLLQEYEKQDYHVKSIIDDYHSGYDAIIFDIIENHDIMPKIKANIREIEENYIGLFKLNYLELYSILIENAPLAVFAILMNKTLRTYFISSENSSANTNYIYEKLKSLVSHQTTKLKEGLGSELKIFKGNTEAYWKDLEPNDKKCMILKMNAGNFVRSSGTFGEELAFEDVEGTFLILDGIDYKSNNASHELLYLEV